MPSSDVSKAAQALAARGASKGGKARAEKLTADQRSESARRAADARWGVPQAEFEGELAIGDMAIPCAVLSDGTRVISETGMVNAFGLYRSGAVHVRARDAGGGAQLPLFLAHKNLKPFVDSELSSVLQDPIWYRSGKGGTRHKGVSAQLIPKICEVWLDARTAGVLGKRQEAAAAKADILLRGLARVGIVALVDEATGYEQVRKRMELHQILEAYITKELLPWAKRFPDEFYEEMFRLRGWDFDPASVKRPVLVGKLTDKVVYKKLPPGVLQELKQRNPRNQKGRRRHKHHQFLTEDIGNAHLEKHLAVVTALMRVSRNWPQFLRLLDKAVRTPGGVQKELFDKDESDEEQ